MKIIRDRVRAGYVQPAIGICEDCGREVILSDPLTNECECGALYNFAGQKLLPRSMWEEQIEDDY